MKQILLIVVFVALNCYAAHAIDKLPSGSEIELTTFSDCSTRAYDIDHLSDNEHLLVRMASLPIPLQQIIVSYVRYETEEEFKKKLEKLCLPTVDYATHIYYAWQKRKHQSIFGLSMPSFSFEAHLYFDSCQVIYYKNSYGIPFPRATLYDHQFKRDTPQNRWEKMEAQLGLNAGSGAWIAGMGLSPNGSSLAFHVQEKRIKTGRVSNAVIGVACLIPGKKQNLIIPVDRKFAQTAFTAHDSYASKKRDDGDIVEQVPNYLMGVSNVGKKVAVAGRKKITVFSADNPHETHTIEDEGVSGNLTKTKDVCTPYLYFNQTNTMLAHLVLKKQDKTRNITIYPLPHTEELLTIPEYFACIGVCKDLVAQVKSWVS